MEDGDYRKCFFSQLWHIAQLTVSRQVTRGMLLLHGTDFAYAYWSKSSVRDELVSIPIYGQQNTDSRLEGMNDPKYNAGRTRVLRFVQYRENHAREVRFSAL